MKLALALIFLALAGCATVPPTRQVAKPGPLPVALDRDFAFKKVKQFLFEPALRPGLIGAALDPSIAFERAYLSYGAITALDQRQRFGNYYTFFWRSKRRANVTVRLEYRQENLHAFVQAREISYVNVRGPVETRFAIIGDDYFDDGRVIAWRASLIVEGRVVAVKRSYLWD